MILLFEQLSDHSKAMYHGFRHHLRQEQRRIAQLQTLNHLLTGHTEDSKKAYLSDAGYASLENQMRGSREEIKQHQRIYLPYIQQAGLGTPQYPLIDLGCGRGEWLELLKDNGFSARGVDTNLVFLQECRKSGLTVKEHDAVSYLRSLKADSVGMVTAFQLIEHLPFNDLTELIEESLRVLVPGGLVILETPNPENVLVGSCYFHLDPTHHKPLPPSLCTFLLSSAGFTDVTSIDLHPFEGFRHSSKDEENLPDPYMLVNRHFLGPRDFAAIGKKAS